VGSKRASEAAPESTNGRLGELNALKRALAERLLGTRAEFQEAVICYSVRVQGMLARIGDVLDEDFDGLSAEDAHNRERALRRALDHLESLDLKPAKGRRRDLKAVETLAADLAAEISDW
jgi:hypothetical protein